MRGVSDVMLYRRSNFLNSAGCHPRPNIPQCGQLPGTILRIFVPPGFVINLLNLIEVASPSGICFIIRLPFIGGGPDTAGLESIRNLVQSAGGTVEVV